MKEAAHQRTTAWLHHEEVQTEGWRTDRVTVPVATGPLLLSRDKGIHMYACQTFAICNKSRDSANELKSSVQDKQTNVSDM